VPVSGTHDTRDSLTVLRAGRNAAMRVNLSS
jgi:hypothetical protein